MFVSEIIKTPPEKFETHLQKLVYETLGELDIPFERVDTGDAVTMDDCIEIDKKLGCKVVKTLFLCNRQKTSFYLFVTPGDKPFVTKDFGKALGVSRVSFAPSEMLLEMMETKVGATTVYSLLLESAKEVRIVFDSEVLNENEYGCTDGTFNCYMKVKTSDITDKLIPFTNHDIEIINV
ncbi:MAG: prolyl-tRNA synthetase associated domain-containing protein [Eubacterium sp.]|nr:prolyl-tRNA synthetase associated domain-containing protein [Eubacterium sp.]MBR1531866.1 prolyl-tRNA synthetase associated domain-containing protein [Eubacterium sp.]